MFFVSGPVYGAQIARIDGGPVDLKEAISSKSRTIAKLQSGEEVTCSNLPLEGFYKVRTKNGEIGWIPTDKILISSNQDKASAPSYSQRVRARNQTPPGRSSFQLAPAVAYGFDDSFKFGVGLRATFKIGTAFNLGARFDYFLGTTVSTSGGSTGTTGVGGIGSNSDSSTSLKAWLLTGELGYDLPLGPTATLRPFLGVGTANFSVSASAAGVAVPTVSGSEMAFVPGAALLFRTGGGYFGADARFAIITSAFVMVAGGFYCFAL